MKTSIGASVAIAVVLFGAAWVLMPGGNENALNDEPRLPGAFGPMSASDGNRDGEVTRAEMQAFVAAGPEHSVGMVAYFDQYDTNFDSTLSPKEMNHVDPPDAFDGSDLDADGVVTRQEVETYASERLYRQMSLLDFFDLVDTDSSGVVANAEMVAAQGAGQLPLEDI